MSAQKQEASHTSGSWTADLTDNIYNEGEPVWGVDGPDYNICMVDGPNDAPNEANARLIAAAPEMLKALEAVESAGVLFAWANEKGIGSLEWSRRCSVVDAVTNSISKAKGQIK
jgi:hypothetical protein